jgi:hypothetical protein
MKCSNGSGARTLHLEWQLRSKTALAASDKARADAKAKRTPPVAG